MCKSPKTPTVKVLAEDSPLAAMCKAAEEATLTAGREKAAHCPKKDKATKDVIRGAMVYDNTMIDQSLNSVDQRSRMKSSDPKIRYNSGSGVVAQMQMSDAIHNHRRMIDS